MIDLGIWKETAYNSDSDNGHLRINAFTLPAPPIKAQVANFLGTEEEELEDGTVNNYPAYFTYNRDTENEYMVAVWYCEQNSYLYIVEISYPKEVWKQKQEEVKSILSGFECV